MEDKLTLAKTNLSPSELVTYQEYVDSGKPPLSPQVQKQLYELFLNGKSCSEIVRLNPNFSLGMVLRARVDGRWDDLRDAHVAELLSGVRERVQHTQTEAVNFACDLMSAVHKLQGDRIKKYLQTGDQEELGKLAETLNLRSYQTVVEMLLKLTGQETNKKVNGEILHKHTVEQSPTAVKLNPSKAAAILAAIQEEEDAEIAS